MSAFITMPSDLEASQSPLILWTAGSVITVAIVSVFLRFLSRLVTRVPLLLDDWLILATLPIAVATSAITIWGCVYHHLGTHVLATGTLDSLHNFLRGLYVFEITYAFSIAGAKFSMMAIYWRIFPCPQLVWPLRVTAGVTGAWLIATVLVPIFSCNPVQGFWMFEIQRTCIDSLAFYIGSAATNIAIDLAMLLIPVSMVWRLRISLSQKLGVCAIFGLGIFVTVCSCLRLNQLVLASSEGLYADPTWDLVGSALWSDIETSASIVCACLPTWRPLLKLVLHGTFKETRHSSSKGSSPSALRTSTGSGHGRYYRFSDDRPLSGMAGDGEWLGKGVGAPIYILQAKAVQIEPKNPEQPSTLAAPLPAFTRPEAGRQSVASMRPPLPTRSPLRRLAHGLSPFSHAPQVVEAPTPARSRQPSHAEMITMKVGMRLDLESGMPDTDLGARTRTLIRDPNTNRYVLSAPSQDPPAPAPTWAAGWEAELDRSVEHMWDASRRPSAATTAATADDHEEVYRWTARQSALPLPTVEPQPGWRRVDNGSAVPHWRAASAAGTAWSASASSEDTGSSDLTSAEDGRWYHATGSSRDVSDDSSRSRHHPYSHRKTTSEPRYELAATEARMPSHASHWRSHSERQADLEPTWEMVSPLSPGARHLPSMSAGWWPSPTTSQASPWHSAQLRDSVDSYVSSRLRDSGKEGYPRGGSPGGWI